MSIRPLENPPARVASPVQEPPGDPEKDPLAKVRIEELLGGQEIRPTRPHYELVYGARNLQSTTKALPSNADPKAGLYEKYIPLNEATWEVVKPRLEHLTGEEKALATHMFARWSGGQPPKRDPKTRARLTGDSAKQYPTIKQLTAALVGNTKAYANREREAKLAKLVGGSSVLQGHLHSVMGRVRDFVDAKPNAEAYWNRVQTGRRGVWMRWGPYKVAGETPRSVMNEPYDDYQNNIGTLKMAIEAMAIEEGYKAVPGVQVNGEWSAVTETPDPTWRYTTTSLNENQPWLKEARALGIPISSGPSNSMARINQALHWVGATPEEKEAVAWLMFAFHYEHLGRYIPGGHTLHEIMEQGAHDGFVDYSADRYQEFLAEGFERFR